MPKVSVVIASYNHEKYVAEAIQSVLDQAYQDFEIVITDDGSTDKTLTEIKKFADPRIRLFCFGENQGQFVATEHCLEKAKGQYIAVLNSDDVFLPDKLEKQIQFLDEHPEIGAVFGYAQIIDGNSQPLADKKNSHHHIFKKTNRTRYEWLKYFFYNGNCLCHPSVLIRRTCHESIGSYDKRYAQLADFDFWIRLCMKYEIHIIQEDLVKFRILPENGNMGSRRPESLKRSYWEHGHILHNYLDIESVQHLLRIFPEAKEYAKEIDRDLIPFVLTILALKEKEYRKKKSNKKKKSSRQIHQTFAVDTIFNLLSNKKTADKLAEKFNFGYIDFIKLTGHNDSFGIAEIKELKTRLKYPVRSAISKLLDSLKK